MGKTTVIAIALAACTHRHQVRELPRDLAGEVATLELEDDATVEARAEPTPVGLAWRDRAGNLVGGERIRSVVVTHHGRGAAHGFLIGGVAGAALGAIGGQLSGDDPPEQFISFSADDKAWMLGVFFGLTAGLAGALIGGVSGSHDEYELVGRPPMAGTPPAPPPSDPALRPVRRRCAVPLARWRGAGDGTSESRRLWDGMPAECRALVVRSGE